MSEETLSKRWQSNCLEKKRNTLFMQNPSGRRLPVPYIAQAYPSLNRIHLRQPNESEQPLPAPTEPAPYHLDLASVLTPAQLHAIQHANKMRFHVIGDTGGVKSPQFQQNVADHMLGDFVGWESANSPAFFYHLGDIVYYYGQANQYYPQFYEPYANYPAPIFAIPGNHDGDVTIGSSHPSLAAFVKNFCAPHPHLTSEAGDTPRDAMTQPNVYWTLETPFVTFVGLYTNVPEGGWMDDAQIAWLATELTNAPQQKALIVSFHHPIYSADVMHSGSQYMAGILDQAIQQTQRWPDLLLSGHVHNYQRFTRSIAGRDVPYLVAGAGGYWNLHKMTTDPQGNPLPVPYPVPNTDATLMNYCDSLFGYLLMEATSTTLTGSYYTVPNPLAYGSNPAPSSLFDTFTLDLQTHRLL
jgi:acid phosphatase type 7